MTSTTAPPRTSRRSSRRPAGRAADSGASIARGWVASPLGPLRLAATSFGLSSVRFTDPESPSVNLGKPLPTTHDAASLHIRQAAQQLDAYFAADLSRFDLPLDPAGSPFCRKVWRALARVHLGRTVSYAELAARAGNPAAARAVGLAMASNPIPVVVPCHRVVRSDGSLGGFGGGLWRKRFLLDHERQLRSTRAAEPRPSQHTVVA